MTYDLQTTQRRRPIARIGAGAKSERAALRSNFPWSHGARPYLLILYPDTSGTCGRYAARLYARHDHAG